MKITTKIILSISILFLLQSCISNSKNDNSANPSERYGFDFQTEEKRGSSESENIENVNTKPFDEIQLTLTDATLKKAKIYLGEPDKYEYYFGHITKGFAIYYNKVANQGGKSKHLILFLRKNPMGTNHEKKIEEINSIEDNEKACFGIHCIIGKTSQIDHYFPV